MSSIVLQGQRLRSDPAGLRIAHWPRANCRAAVEDVAVLDFVRARGSHWQVMLCVCIGSFVLAAAGILRPEMRVTTHWKVAAQLRALVTDVAENRWTRDADIRALA